MKEMRFSQQITNIGTSRFVGNHRQRVWYRMVDSVCRLNAQGADATPPWNTPHFYPSLFPFEWSREFGDQANPWRITIRLVRVDCKVRFASAETPI
jgi:hypothetical protein